jgi:hypothetical protein
MKEVAQIAWSLTRNEKPIVLFERHCHATEKSEAIACARSCRSSFFGPKKNNWNKYRAEEEDRHKGSLTQKNEVAQIVGLLVSTVKVVY